MAKTKRVLYRKKDSVLIATISRPNSKNIIGPQMVEQFAGLRNQIVLDHHIRVIIITGAGRESFSRGADLEQSRQSEKGPELLGRLSIASIVSQLERPTIAAINGDAFGQGLELALACDLRICAEHARLAMPQIQYGEIPWDGGTQRLSRLVGRGKALELVLAGEAVDAQEAYRIGLVNQVIPYKKLMETAMDVARKIASRAPIALKYAKEAVHKGMDMTLEQGLRLESDLYLLLQTTRDRIEGIRAFQGKRSPHFDGE